MKSLLNLISFAFFFSFLISCDSSHPQTELELKNPESSQLNKKVTLDGKWRVTKYVFSDISAMDEKVASEWVGKVIEFSQVVVFPFSTIPSYKIKSLA